MAKEPEEVQPDPGKVDPVQHQEAPEWAKRLQSTLEELPSRLTATVTDEHIGKISEGVHSLFERSGAFEKPADPPKEGEPEEEKKDDTPEKPKSERQSFAHKHFGG